MLLRSGRMRAASAIGHPNRGVRAERCLPGGLFVASGPRIKASRIQAMTFELSPAHHALSSLTHIALNPRSRTLHSGRPIQNTPFRPLGNPSPLFRLTTESNTGFRSEADLGRVFADHPVSETLQTPIGQMRGIDHMPVNYAYSPGPEHFRFCFQSRKEALSHSSPAWRLTP